MGHDMPCGNCPVCDDLIDFSEAGICNLCGQAFHWNECGRWVGNEHVCDSCNEDAHKAQEESNGAG